jgi:cyanate lyase
MLLEAIKRAILPMARNRLTPNTLDNTVPTHPAIARFFGIAMILGGVMWALLAPIIAVGTVLHLLLVP